jgi:hypothetical protein
MLAPRVIVPAAVIGTVAVAGAIALAVRLAKRERRGPGFSRSSASVWSSGSRPWYGSASSSSSCGYDSLSAGDFSVGGVNGSTSIGDSSGSSTSSC